MLKVFFQCQCHEMWLFSKRMMRRLRRAESRWRKLVRLLWYFIWLSFGLSTLNLRLKSVNAFIFIVHKCLRHKRSRSYTHVFSFWHFIFFADSIASRSISHFQQQVQKGVKGMSRWITRTCIQLMEIGEKLRIARRVKKI